MDNIPPEWRNIDRILLELRRLMPQARIRLCRPLARGGLSLVCGDKITADYLLSTDKPANAFGGAGIFFHRTARSGFTSGMQPSQRTIAEKSRIICFSLYLSFGLQKKQK